VVGLNTHLSDLHDISARGASEPNDSKNVNQIVSFLGAFPKQLREETISIVTSIRPSLYMEERDSSRTNFREISYLGFLLKSVDKF
jgi:hypothetical protein